MERGQAGCRWSARRPCQSALIPGEACCCSRVQYCDYAAVADGGILFGGVHIPVATAAKLVGILVAGSIPFSAMGLRLATSPNQTRTRCRQSGLLEMSFCSDCGFHCSCCAWITSGWHSSCRPFHTGPVGAEYRGPCPESHSGLGYVEALIAFHPGLPWSGCLGYRRDEARPLDEEGRHGGLASAVSFQPLVER